MTTRSIAFWPNRWDLIVIPCGARKEPVAAPAYQLYRGPYVRACLRTALMLPADEYRVLSAKYGLVSFTEILEPYEQRLDRPGAITLDDVRAQVEAQGLRGARRVLALCAGPYRSMVRQLWPDAICPLHGGIGIQMAQLKSVRRGGMAGTLVLEA